MGQALYTVTRGIKNAYLGKPGDYSVPTHRGNQMHQVGLHPSNSIKFYQTGYIERETQYSGIASIQGKHDQKKINSSCRLIVFFSFRYNWQFFHLICIKEKPVSYVKGTTSVHIAVVANSGFLKLQDNNSNSMGGQRIVHLIRHKCLQFSPQRILQNLI